MLTNTFKTPYYAVIFTSTRTSTDEGYDETNQLLEELVKEIDGFMGVDSARSQIGITVSYWRDLESINNWRHNLEHKLAKQKGQSDWYQSYTLRIAKVEMNHSFTNNK